MRKKDLLDMLMRAERPLTSEEIAGRMDERPQNVRQAVRRAVLRGEIVSLGLRSKRYHLAGLTPRLLTVEQLLILGARVRACGSCPSVYTGDLPCPVCGQPGEPIDQIEASGVA